MGLVQVQAGPCENPECASKSWRPSGEFEVEPDPDDDKD
jgi:hypothetical protein